MIIIPKRESWVDWWLCLLAHSQDDHLRNDPVGRPIWFLVKDL